MATHIRVDEVTPCGGAYSELWYMDDNWEVCDEQFATKCVIRECTSDGKLLLETWGRVKTDRVKPEP